ncbi:B2 bradykinin receptor-like isoform X1 [Erpetoichthys calabaricus]|uniref:B2 bradykinin receptor n=2 Tax=Erpetoichthys calabaricus TaxID=27687 RepID=A0A8C4SL24_ERPCA|nr:B2 bradykinin receptor-like isoform X1 [Erpetoichthys calabaricus]
MTSSFLMTSKMVTSNSTSLAKTWINNTDSTSCFFSATMWEWIRMIGPIYISIVCILGFVGNAFVLCVFCLHKKKCTIAEIYLANLATADLVMVSCLPFWAVNVANDLAWTFGDLLCKIIGAGTSMNMYCSIYFLVAVSIDRYLALVKALSEGRSRSTSLAKVTCAVIWVFGLIMSIPKLLKKVEHFPAHNVSFCYLNYTHTWQHLLNNNVLTIVGFLIPFLCILYCTYEIIKVLRNNSMQNFRVKTEKKATHLILAVLLVFFICWIPFHVATFIDTLLVAEIVGGCALKDLNEFLSQCLAYLAYTNSCVNPILYVIVGKGFRKKAMGLFQQLRNRWDKANVSVRSYLSSTNQGNTLSIYDKDSSL